MLLLAGDEQGRGVRLQASQHVPALGVSMWVCLWVSTCICLCICLCVSVCPCVCVSVYLSVSVSTWGAHNEQG